jgi:hypothetical protein
LAVVIDDPGPRVERPHAEPGKVSVHSRFLAGIIADEGNGEQVGPGAYFFGFFFRLAGLLSAGSNSPSAY